MRSKKPGSLVALPMVLLVVLLVVLSLASGGSSFRISA